MNPQELLADRQLNRVEEVPEHKLKTMVAIGYRVIVEVEPPEKVSAGGIVLGKTANQFRREQGGKNVGKVFLIGDTAWKDKLFTLVPKVGDTVYFKRYAGPEITFKNTNRCFIMVNDEDIFAILPEELAEEVDN